MAGFDEAFRSIVVSNPAKLKLKDSNLCIENSEGVATFSLKEIFCILLESPQITITSALLSALADKKVVLLSCDSSYHPNGVFYAYLGNYQNSRILKDQIDFSKHKKAILWQQIIKSKVQNQAEVLLAKDKVICEKLNNLAKLVKLKDATHIESTAAAIYFPALFYKYFTRDEFCTINSALNYGYSVIRAKIARDLAISGLNPSLGLFHDNLFNPFNLADDMIEPYRAFVDKKVFELYSSGRLGEFLTKEIRCELIEILSHRAILEGKVYPISRCISRTIQSLSACIQNKENELKLPILGAKDGEVYESDCDV